MKSIPTLAFGLSLTAAATLGVVVPACGDGDTINMGTTVSRGGASGTAGHGDSGSGGSGDGAVPGGELCAGKPCADHTGNKDFLGAGAPSNAEELFEDATKHPAGSDAAHEPAIVYPSHETMFPINVSRIRHEWSGGAGNGLYQLRFEGPKTTVTVYTTDTNWLPSEEEWDWIAESNRGESVEFSVTALAPATPTDAWASSPIELLFSRAEVEGAIYYWSTGTKGIMKALVSDPLPVKFYTDPAATDADTCVACHTLSRDGKRLAVGYGGETLREVSVPDRTVIVPSGAMPAPMPMPMPMPKPGPGGGGMPSAWTTFSPDGTRLLVAANGVLTLIDSDTGATVGDNAGVVTIPAGTFATHPDWSALGDQVVITLGTKGGNKEIEGGSIALIKYDGTTWGAPEIIVQSSGLTDNNFFPVWSPDSKWIAFVNAAAKSKDAVSATLRLLEVSTKKVVTMTRINERVNNENGVTGIGNSMPTWAPSTKPGIFWLAFSSLRAYATVRPQDAKLDQIWIGAVDPTLADPGYAGFWAPFQSLEYGNHRAFWTHTSEDKQCGCIDICGDNLDNDCDGQADEADCGQCGPKEICGDGIDNDCNCIKDECNQEICNDGIDNDGDGFTDSADQSCNIH